MTPEETYWFGSPEQQADFTRRNARFFEVWPRLHQATRIVFERQFTPSDDAQWVVFTLGKLVLEDLMEIVLVCANGYGAAGLKVLRPMYEATITAGYLLRNPGEVDAFLGYHHVHERRVLTIADRVGVDLSNMITPSEREQIEAAYQEVKHNYRRLHSWNKKGVLEMAVEIGFGQSALWLNFWPTLHIHTTPTRLRSRLEETAEGMVFRSGPQPEIADRVLLGAHVCVAFLLADQNRHFGLGLHTLEADLDKNFRHAWSRGEDRQ
jgi:hypothetical protein